MKPVHTFGTRKRAVARATLKEGKGKIKLNHRYVELYEPEMHRLKLMEPLFLAGDIVNSVDIDVNVLGGGVNSQIEAARLAIARALTKYNAKLKKVYLDYDRQLLVADVRRKEMCKPNRSKARAKRQKSYR